MLYDMLAGGVMVTDRSGHVVVTGKEGGGYGCARLHSRGIMILIRLIL